jgi:hypothetical protein
MGSARVDSSEAREEGPPRPAGAEAPPDAIVRDVVYAQAILDQARRATEAREARSRSWLLRASRVLTNGFVLLIAGALISNWLVPRFQRQQQEREARLAARKEVLAQFLLYTNLRWQEYYLLPPLLAHPELTRAQYEQTLRDLTRIKIARYDAFAKVEAMALAFRRSPGERNAELEDALESYAVRINDFSRTIDAWLRNAYCYANECEDSAAAPVDPDFDPYRDFVKIQDDTVALIKLDSSVATLISANITKE